ncbi:vesicle coat component, partial [Ascosphaera acerosa]
MQLLTLLTLFTALVLPASALKFDLLAQHQGSAKEQCVRNFVGRDQLVVVTAIVGGVRGDGQQVDMH